jgi:rhamnose utilization protein RhaD (predicted bifunctional aldolase and dehydrogenase)
MKGNAMKYAQVIDGKIETIGRLPDSGEELDGRAWVMGLSNASVAKQEACGWFVLNDDAVRPADTAEESSDRTIKLVNGRPTVVFTVRPKTDAELTADAEQAERDAVTERIKGAVEALERIQQVREMSNAQQTEAIRQLAAAAVHLVKELTL